MIQSQVTVVLDVSAALDMGGGVMRWYVGGIRSPGFVNFMSQNISPSAKFTVNHKFVSVPKQVAVPLTNAPVDWGVTNGPLVMTCNLQSNGWRSMPVAQGNARSVGTVGITRPSFVYWKTAGTDATFMVTHTCECMYESDRIWNEQFIDIALSTLSGASQNLPGAHVLMFTLISAPNS